MSLYLNKRSVFAALLLLGLLHAGFIYALELNWPVSPQGTALTDSTDLTGFIQYVYEWGITLGAVAVFYSLVMGGFKYLTSTGSPDKMRDARDQIISAFSGFLLLLSSFLILNTINPDLTELKIPVLPDAGDVFAPLDPPDEQPLQACSKVYVYPTTDCSEELGPPVGLTANAPLDSAHWTFKPKSVCKFYDDATGEEGGLCVIHLYSDTACTTPVDGGSQDVFLNVPAYKIDSALKSDFDNLNCIKATDI
jgi:hypothetical protein